MKKNGLYGYYDTEKEYVVYIGKDANIGNDTRHKVHTNPERYDEQVINKIIQNNLKRYTYFRFIEGEYNDETLNELEKEAIRLFKTYKYDYPERNVFNFQRGGEGGFAGGRHSPGWRKKDYIVTKRGMSEGKQNYCIRGRYSKTIKYSTNKKKLEELTNKLNTNKITEEEVRNIQLCDRKELAKNARQSNVKYNIWDISYCHYNKTKMLQHHGGDRPRKCFKYKYKGYKMPIGGFHDFVTCQIIDSIVKEAIKNEK